jgi:hypothetical protein
MKAERGPAALTDAHRERVGELLARTSARLESLEIEGLLERFKGLPKASKTKFLQLASAILKET